MIKKILPIAIFINFLVVLTSGYFVLKMNPSFLEQSDLENRLEESNLSVSKDALREISIINEIGTNKSTNYIPNILQYIKTKDLKYCEKISYNNERMDGVLRDICKNSLLDGKINKLFIEKQMQSYAELSEDIELIELLHVANGQGNCSDIKKDLYRYLQCKKFLDPQFDINDLYTRIQKSVRISESQYKKGDFSYIKNFGLEDDIIPVLKALLKNYFGE